MLVAQKRHTATVCRGHRCVPLLSESNRNASEHEEIGAGQLLTPTTFGLHAPASENRGYGAISQADGSCVLRVLRFGASYRHSHGFGQRFYIVGREVLVGKYWSCLSGHAYGRALM